MLTKYGALTMIAVLTILLTLTWYWHNIKKDKSTTEIFLFNELSKESPNKYLVEKLFFDLYKCGKTNFEEIKILSEHPYPLEAVKKFSTFRYFGRIFEFKRHNGEVSVEFTNRFNSKIKRVIIVTISTMVMIVSYFLILFFTTKTTISIVSIIQLGNVKTDNILVELLKSPEPVIFSLLTIVSTVISMCSLAYIFCVLRAKKTVIYFKGSYEIIN